MKQKAPRRHLSSALDHECDLLFIRHQPRSPGGIPAMLLIMGTPSPGLRGFAARDEVLARACFNDTRLFVLGIKA